MSPVSVAWPRRPPDLPPHPPCPSDARPPGPPHAFPHTPHPQAPIDFSALRVADLQQTIDRYNALLAFEQTVLSACRKANLLTS